MKLKTVLFALCFFITPVVCLCQTAKAPLNRAEILGKLASGASRSYLAHLVKTQGINFSSDAHYLSLIARAGGNGILFDRLSSASAVTSSSSLSDADPPFEHLANCAELLQAGATQEAETACRAAIDENPASPWPLLATLRAIEREDVKPSDTLELARRAVALAPNLAEAHLQLATALPRNQPNPEVLAEMQRALANADRASADPLSYAASEGMDLPGTLGRANEAPDAVIQRLLTTEPDFAPTHVLAANFYQTRGPQDHALSEMREAVRLEPDNAELHASFADFYRNSGDMESQLAELREAVRAEPKGDPPRQSLARTLQELDRLPEAITEFKNLLGLYPKDSLASAMLVDIYLQQKNRQLAIEELRRFLKATSIGIDEPTHMGKTWAESQRLAQILYANGELDAAATQYLEILHFRPEDADIHNDYGNVLLAQNKIDGAAAEYREALRYKPDMSTAHHNLGICLMRKNDLDGAVAEYHTALGLNPDEPNTHVMLGIALGTKGDLDSAVSEFRRMISENPDDAWAHANLGHALELKHDLAAAIPELKQALELNPDIRVAENDLAWLYATAPDSRYRDPKAALQHAKHAVALLQQPPTPSSEEFAALLDTLAEALLLNGQASEALTTEERAVGLDSKNAELKTRFERFRKAAHSPQPPEH